MTEDQKARRRAMLEIQRKAETKRISLHTLFAAAHLSTHILHRWQHGKAIPLWATIGRLEGQLISLSRKAA